jgi:MFS family permease
MIGMLESATGLGLMMGPLLGALISAIFSFSEAYKYQMVFYLLAATFALFVYPSY